MIQSQQINVTIVYSKRQSRNVSTPSVLNPETMPDIFYLNVLKLLHFHMAEYVYVMY